MAAMKKQLSYEHQAEAIKQAAQKAIKRPVKIVDATMMPAQPAPARLLQDKLKAEYAADAPFVAHRETWVQIMGVLVILTACWGIGFALYGNL